MINMLKGLKNESIFEVIQSSEKKKFRDKKGDKYNSESVTGNTELPQIRELNEIASILRSMNGESNKSFD